MKTIRELSSKIWYRSFKVIYVLVFIIIFSYIVKLISEKFAPYKIIDNDKSLIICDSGNAYTFKEYYYNNSGFVEKEKFCLSAQELEKRNKVCSEYGERYSGLKNYIERIRLGLPDPPPLPKECQKIPINYKVKEVYKIIGGWHLVVGYSIFVALVMFGIWILIRKIFYYILLSRLNLLISKLFNFIKRFLGEIFVILGAYFTGRNLIPEERCKRHYSDPFEVIHLWDEKGGQLVCHNVYHKWLLILGFIVLFVGIIMLIRKYLSKGIKK